MRYNTKISVGMIYAAATFVLSVLIGFYVYRFLWNSVSKSIFTSWFTIFEFSQLLLLLDIGFTHSFIKKYINADKNTIFQALPELRGALLIAGVIGALVCLLIADFTSRSNIENAPYICYVFLAGSIAVTLWGYTDAAVLRIQHKFELIYLINIFSNIIFFLFLFLNLFKDAVITLAIATLIRSIIQVILQLLAAGCVIALKAPKISNGSFSVISLNLSYFLFFSLDALILTFLHISVVTIAFVLILRKYYDSPRGLCDSLMNVASVAFAKYEDKKRDLLLIIFIIVSFIGAFVIAGPFIRFWLHTAEFSFEYSVAIGISTMMLSIFRVHTLRLYFQGRMNARGPFLIFIIVKGIFLVALYATPTNVSIAYFLQAAVLLALLSCFGKSLFVVRTT